MEKDGSVADFPLILLSACRNAAAPGARQTAAVQGTLGESYARD